jgi:hypothetical protein
MVQWVPAVGQSLVVALQLPFRASQRQTDRQLCVPACALQMSPGPQVAELEQASPSCPVRDASGQLQST